MNVMGDEPLVEVSDINVSALGPDRPPDIYAAILDVRREWMGKVVKHLATPGTLPALYHCNSGRDRAGLVTMLLLSIANVPAEDHRRGTIAHRRRIYGGASPTARPESASVLDPGGIQRLRGVPAGLTRPSGTSPRRTPCETSIEHLQREYGGVRPYLTGAGVTEEELERLRIGDGRVIRRRAVLRLCRLIGTPYLYTCVAVVTLPMCQSTDGGSTTPTIGVELEDGR